MQPAAAPRHARHPACDERAVPGTDPAPVRSVRWTRGARPATLGTFQFGVGCGDTGLPSGRGPSGRVAGEAVLTETPRALQATLTWQPCAATTEQSVESDGPGTHLDGYLMPEFLPSAKGHRRSLRQSTLEAASCSVSTELRSDSDFSGHAYRAGPGTSAGPGPAHEARAWGG